MKMRTIGIDLAKSVFQVHGVDTLGKAVFKKQTKGDQMVTFFTNLMPCLIGMEACGSAHFWARKLQAMGHTVWLMAPQFVKPYVKTNKNDMADAEAICEAVSRPNMRFVPIKDVDQQAVLAVHRVRQGMAKGAHRPGQSDARPVERIRAHHPARYCLHQQARFRLGGEGWRRVVRRISRTGAAHARSPQGTGPAGWRAGTPDQNMAPASRCTTAIALFKSALPITRTRSKMSPVLVFLPENGRRFQTPSAILGE